MIRLGTYMMSRGVMGNYGQQKLLYPGSGPLRDSLDSIPSSWLKPGLSNANLLRDGGLVPQEGSVLALVPPPTAFDEGTRDARRLGEVVDEYLRLGGRATGSQAGIMRRREEVIDIVRKSTHATPPGSVAYPRFLRRYGSAYLLTEPTYVSTNFGVISPDAADDSQLTGPVLHAWLRSVFSLANRFVLDKNQEGGSKVELGTMRELRVPRVDVVTPSIVDRVGAGLAGEPFLDFANLHVTEVDRQFAQAMWGEAASMAIEEALDVVSDNYFDRQT